MEEIWPKCHKASHRISGKLAGIYLGSPNTGKTLSRYSCSAWLFDFIPRLVLTFPAGWLGGWLAASIGNNATYQLELGLDWAWQWMKERIWICRSRAYSVSAGQKWCKVHRFHVSYTLLRFARTGCDWVKFFTKFSIELDISKSFHTNTLILTLTRIQIDVRIVILIQIVLIQLRFMWEHTETKYWIWFMWRRIQTNGKLGNASKNVFECQSSSCWLRDVNISEMKKHIREKHQQQN